MYPPDVVLECAVPVSCSTGLSLEVVVDTPVLLVSRCVVATVELLPEWFELCEVAEMGNVKVSLEVVMSAMLVESMSFEADIPMPIATKSPMACAVKECVSRCPVFALSRLASGEVEGGWCVWLVSFAKRA
jgi:hypothetical protein